MSFARGDLARRAALADNLAVPEPWSSNDDPRVFAAIRDLRDEFRQLGITDEDGKGRLPDFLLDYENLPPIKPTTLDRAHSRNSSATRWDQNGNLVEDSSDTLRLQRDPKTQEPLGLLYEPKRTQLFGAPQDITAADWTKDNVSTSSNVGAAKGQNFDQIIESNDSSDKIHQVYDQVAIADNTPGAASFIVKANGRNWVKILLRGAANDEIWYNIGNGKLGTVSFPNTEIDAGIDDLGGGWYKVKAAGLPPSNEQYVDMRLSLANGDGVNSYTGDGTSGIFVMHAQAEVSREVTTPILSGSATRGADGVDHRFDFPDRTTGVAYSIEQQYGDNVLFGGPIRFGDTGSANDRGHGVLMHHNGLNGEATDGFKTKTRNSDEDSEQGRSITGDTITKFLVSPTGTNLGGSTSDSLPSLTVRQIAIHRQPHTAAQKDTLRDQYLTQP